jgi:hypothetical protein
LLTVGELETQDVAEADSWVLINKSIITLPNILVTYAKNGLP